MSEDKKPLPSAVTLRRIKDGKPRRALTLIALALAAALAFLLFVLIRPQAAPEGTEAEGTSFQLIERDRTLLHSITVEMAGSDPYTLINQNDYDMSDKNDVLGEEYALEGQPDFAVSTANVLPMESYASDLSVQDLAARGPEDLEQYGLKAPSMTVTIGYRDNVREKLIFGGPVPTGGYYYLQHVGDPAVYVAAESIYEAFHRPLDELKQTAEEKANLDAARALEATAQPDGADTTANPSDAEATTGADVSDATPYPSAPVVTAQPGLSTVTTQP
mgnify:CR=1 FL=1